MGKAIHFTDELFKFQFKYQPKPKFTSIYIFGDSLSDNGNLSSLIYKASGGTISFPPSPPYFNSQPLLSPPQIRFSNGLVWADTLPASLGISSTKVNNYAYGGATSGFTNGLQPLFPNLPLPGLLTEVNSFTKTTLKADPKGLYVVWAGANDGFNLAGLLASQPPSSLQAAFPIITDAVKTAINNITTAITTLANSGARTFLVPNLPNLGKTPLLSQNQASAFVGKAFSVLFDIGLAITLPKLERSLKIDIVQPDVYSLAEDVFNRPEEYGFKNVTDPLIGQNPLTVNPEDFFWFDSQHPTTKGQAILTDFFQDSLFAAGYGKGFGYGKHESDSNLTQLLGSPLAKDAIELALGSGLFQGISDFKSLGLGKDLLGLIGDKSFLSFGNTLNSSELLAPHA